jgi:hypothetical protein
MKAEVESNEKKRQPNHQPFMPSVSLRDLRVSWMKGATSPTLLTNPIVILAFWPFNWIAERIWQEG